MPASLNRRQFALGLGALAASRRLRAQAAKKPNILVLLTSEHRADALGIMRSAIVKTPVLDRLGREGALLRNLYTTSPSHAGAMAGLFREPWPALLKKAGYRTALAGGVELPDGVESGFEELHRVPGPEYRAFLDERYPKLEGDYNRLASPRPEAVGEDIWAVGESLLPAQDFPTYWTADRVIERIEANGDDPWFCVAGFVKPSAPYVLPLPWPQRYPWQQVALPALPTEPPTPRVDPDSARYHCLAPQKEYIQHLAAVYYGAIAFIDEQVGRIVNTLRSSEQLDNTLIVMTSDYGNMLGDHGRMLGHVPYESALRVPGLIRYPKAVPAGTVVEPTLSTASLPATILEMAGLDAAGGRSALPLLQGKSEDWDETVYASDGFRTVRTPEWKLTLPGDHPHWEPQLFHLAADRGETSNLYGKPEGAEAQQQLSDLLASQS